ncbi:MAG: DUF6198 family protein [Lachnospiraceae bacterium]|jgi:uncharacterized membrane protein YczE|nr:DUF6198 family protein [Lachnospiraceae bacterium]MCI1727666.1 DUF6198 family protein [Lachnospiraceae bacterium]
MKTGKIFYTEAAYAAGLTALAMSSALMEAADFGMSMVVAPAYLVYRKLSMTFPFVTFGMSEYLFQALLLTVLILVLRRFRVRYLFSFVTAVLYGFLLDGCIRLTAFIPAGSLAVRILLYAAGLIVGAMGVSLLFHTYLSPEVYELFVREIAEKYGFQTHRVKMCYDCASCLLAVVLSFAFFGFGHFEGIKFGTILCALVNGWMIGRWTRLLEAKFEFRDRFRK